MLVLPLGVLGVLGVLSLVALVGLVVWALRRRGPGVTPVSLVINLPKNRDRMRVFTEAYSASDLAVVPVQRVPAVDGKSVDWSRFLTSEALERLMTVQAVGYREAHPDLTPGAVGCYLSHMRAWKAVADSGKPYGLVFEDDAAVPPKAWGRIQAAVDRVPRNWDILLLGWEGSGNPMSGPVWRVDRFLRLHAYAISAKAAAQLVDTMLPISQQIDWELSSRISAGLQVFAVMPQLVPVRWQGTDVQVPLEQS